jgi:hypothetical protein
LSLTKNPGKLLVLLTVLLILLSLWVIYSFGLKESRIVRLSSTLVFFLFLLFKVKNFPKLLLWAFVLLLLQDILFINYEYLPANVLTLLSGISAYLLITRHVFSRIRFSKASKYILGVAVVLILLNFYFLYYLTELFENKLETGLQLGLIYLYGAVLILMGIAGYTFNSLYSGTLPLFYLFFVFCFILSDISALPAYYMGIEEAYYPDRVFYILGLSLFCKYALELEKNPVLIKDERLL